MTVTLEHLFPHLDELIQTPADVQRLNEAILQLAVQGKLVPQDPHDEPARELLKRIEKEKEKLVVEGKIEKEKSLPSIDEDDVPFTLPMGWEWARLADAILAVQTGPFGSTLHKADYVENGTPVVNPANIQEDYIRVLPEMMIGEDTLKRLDRYILEEGDIVMARRGEMGRCALVTAREAGWLCGSGSFALKTSPEIFRSFLINVIRSPKSRAYLAGGSVGATMSNLNHRILNNLVIGIPPLAEQKRIVAKVDELFAQTRALEAKLRRAEEAIVVVNRAVLHHLHHAADRAAFQHAAEILGDHFDLLYTDPRPVTDLRQTILQLAVQGKLVPQDPHDEPAEELLKRIDAEKERLVAEGEIKRDELSPIEIEIFPLVPIQILCDVKGGIQKSRDRQPGQNPRRYLTVAHVQRNLIDAGDPRYFEVSDEELERWRLIKGDILIVEGNGSAEHIGRSAIFMGEIEDCVHQNHVIRVRPNLNFILPPYLNLYLNSPAGKEVMLERSRTTSGLFNLSVGRIKTIEVPLPSIQEQKRIVAKVDELLARCAALESKLGQAQVAGRQLTAAVLQGAVG